MTDWTPSSEPNPQLVAQVWILYTNGTWGHLGAGASTVLISPSGTHSKYAAKLSFKPTNNVAEYNGLILGFNKAKALGAQTILVKTNSQVVAGQVEEYSALGSRIGQVFSNCESLRMKVPRFHTKRS
jgi:ribonuclease HI